MVKYIHVIHPHSTSKEITKDIWNKQYIFEYHSFEFYVNIIIHEDNINISFLCLFTGKESVPFLISEKGEPFFSSPVVH
jgi:hypothetical protein